MHDGNKYACLRDTDKAVAQASRQSGGIYRDHEPRASASGPARGVTLAKNIRNDILWSTATAPLRSRLAMMAIAFTWASRLSY